MNIRPATGQDHPAMADLRWRLKTDDGALQGAISKARFAADYCNWLNARQARADTSHLLLVDPCDQPVGIMTLRMIDKEPSPSAGAARIGYLTNSYILPRWRNAGHGARLLQAVINHAKQADLELLLVWPSENAFRFYRRAGFVGAEGDLPLQLMLAEGPRCSGLTFHQE